MSIQGNLNQVLGNAASLASLGRMIHQGTEGYKTKETGIALQKQFEGTTRTLYDIHRNMLNPEKNYSQTELDDLRSRTRELNKSLYDVKVAELDPRYKKYINTSSLKQPQISEINRVIEQGISDRRSKLNALKTPPEPLGELPVHESPVNETQIQEPENTTPKLLPSPGTIPLLPEQVAIPQGPITSSPEERLKSINNEIYKLEKQKWIKQRMASRKAESSLLDNAQSKLDTQMKESSGVDLPAPTTNETENMANMSLTNSKQNKLDSKTRFDALKEELKNKTEKDATYYKNLIKNATTRDELDLIDDDLSRYVKTLDFDKMVIKKLGGYDKIMDTDDFLEYAFNVDKGRYKKFESFKANKTEELKRLKEKGNLQGILDAYIWHAFIGPAMQEVQDVHNEDYNNKIESMEDDDGTEE